MKKEYFGYVRVSTAKQGEKGVSLEEQRQAIERYSQRYGLLIARWFEERETAAKRGRAIFGEMLQFLRRGQACGVVMHKIDRGARNLKDWADLGDLADTGFEIHFANESLDLNTRGGRLSADIQAVVAADYIRNLREETKKGFYGRLKQGILPMSAPIGYQNRGGGKVKEPDAVMAPLVHKAFQLYATRQYSLTHLVEEMYQSGLRNRKGGKVTINGISTLLNNPFYFGVIRIKKTAETFSGGHEPIISKALFDHVQAVLNGKTVDRLVKHEFIFRRMIRCAACRYHLVGEIQKGHVYYRCHRASCKGKTFREEEIDDEIKLTFDSLAIDEFEAAYIRAWLRSAREQQEQLKQQEINNWRLQLDQIRSRLARLTDAFVDGNIDKALFEERKTDLILEEAAIKGKIRSLELDSGRRIESIGKFLELTKTASNLYKTAIPVEKRDFVKRLTSNLVATSEKVVIEPRSEVVTLANRQKIACGSPRRDVGRTWDTILKKLLELFTKNSEGDLALFER
jgi:site-specific DNA recombinase